MVLLGRKPAQRPPASDDPDLALVERALVHPAAFDELVLRYRTPLLRYFFAKLGDWQDAEDLTQETLIDAFGRLAAFAPRKSATFRSWLFAIAHHKRVDEHRKRAVRRPVPFPDAPGWADPAPTPETLALQADAAADLRRLINLLKPDERAVLSLRAADLTTKEIAAALGKSEANVRQLQTRAFARVRAALPAPTKPGGRS
jgi:RNA polymerase sigma-70 factor (ECF subfamily)